MVVSVIRGKRSAARSAWALALVVLSCFPETDPNAHEPPASSSSKGGARAGSGGHSSAVSSGGQSGGSSQSNGGVPDEDDPVPEAGAAGAPWVQPNGRCIVAKTATEFRYPAREVVVSADARPTEQEIFVSSIFSEFVGQCGRCHANGSSSGGMSLTESTFPNVDAAKLLARIKDGTMPTDRPQDENTAHFAQTLQSWIAAGSPKDVIRIPLPPSESDPYLLSTDVGAALSSLGNCVPETTFPFAWERAKMKELDAMFAALGPVQTALPQNLSDTDLFSLDSAVLGRYGVIAFEPAYPLWSDGSGKIRHVRVPYGQSIHFDKKTQTFDIPPNTRFYKTFLKKIVDTNGETRFRKIETRLIVARPDNGVGLGHTTALFGSYKWNDAETEAVLQSGRLNNGEVFADELLTYITDEPGAQAIRDKNPANVTFELERAKVVRHYAIPGRDRCVQCHMGSPSADFVLGFTPLQLVRRPFGEGGVFEPTEGDALTQLERLVALGVVSGIDSAEDIVPLEQTQGTRVPRNEQELTAQAYMLGNCAHCHNPRGYPPAAAPELTILNFYPGLKGADGKVGGIFQFSLELMSPRVKRSLEGRPIPYITPSLRDMIPYNWQASFGGDPTYTPKFTFSSNSSGTSFTASNFLDAPWRSLIYRNVHNPFAYADDFTIFPHMPMNTAGYDCRARRLLGDWMVSIPAQRKNETLNEDFVSIDNNPADTRSANGTQYMDNESQPYREVCNPAAKSAGCVDAGADGYAAAMDAAAARLMKFHAGDEYTKCPDASDIVDPSVGRDRGDNGDPVITPRDVLAPIDGVPDRAHWVSTDLTEPSVDWEPRQTTWNRVLLHQDFPPVDASNQIKVAQREEEKKIVGILSQMNLTAEFEQFATTPFPLALWKQKPECAQKLAQPSVPTGASFTGAQRLRWFEETKVAAAAPIYQTLPGGAIYDMVCVNCHGRGFDAQGRQAETVQQMTGGTARVANFIKGLFGPPSAPGDNRNRVFGAVASQSFSADDLGARYMAWMALGGTDKTIPQAVLQIVSRTDVAGTPRALPLLTDASANMLAAGKAACELVLPLKTRDVDRGGANQYALGTAASALITKNGDAELWQRVCSVGNRPVIRAFDASGTSWRAGPPYLFKADKYPAGASVGDHFGNTVKWSASSPSTNYFPWCIKPPFTQPEPPAAPLPVCPDAVVAASEAFTSDELYDWTRHGAINAGMAVFMYIDQVSKGKWNPRRYDECETLPAP